MKSSAFLFFLLSCMGFTAFNQQAEGSASRNLYALSKISNNSGRLSDVCFGDDKDEMKVNVDKCAPLDLLGYAFKNYHYSLSDEAKMKFFGYGMYVAENHKVQEGYIFAVKVLLDMDDLEYSEMIAEILAKYKGSDSSRYHHYMALNLIKSAGKTGGDFDEIKFHLLRAHEEGRETAMLDLAMFLINSNCKNDKDLEGISILSEQSSMGNVQAKRLLGMLVFDGVCIEKNEKKGLGLLEQAANAGDHKAQSALGMALASIASRERSFELLQAAERWLIKASESRDKSYLNLLIKFYNSYSKVEPKFNERLEELRSNSSKN